MNENLPAIYLARHGETAWSLSGQHTGLTDLPLTERGERNARRLGERLHGLTFAKVFTSPLQRAARTCDLAGFGAMAEVDPDLVEWNYGVYEGRRTVEIRAERSVVSRVRSIQGDVLLFSSGHFPRVLAARWLGLEPAAGQFFALDTASLSAPGHEHTLSRPVVRLWNDTRHTETRRNHRNEKRSS
jgi:probable phosphoglycerate mutase